MIEVNEMEKISIHSPHARGDSTLTSVRPFIGHFNPLPSCEGRQIKGYRFGSNKEFQSTPLMRGETERRKGSSSDGAISIHSPHARGDRDD